MALPVLREGSTGDGVRQWQLFLIGEELLNDVADGIFGPATRRATQKYQRAKGLTDDAVVGSKTYAKAIEDGFSVVVDEEDFPPRPSFRPLVGTLARQQVFGKFSFQPAPIPSNRERIKILGDWEQKNIARVQIPTLQGIDTFGTPNSGRMRFHKKAAEQLKAMWAAWAANNLIDQVQTFGGSFVARFIRGSTSTLSNHAFGSAFDINMRQNALGKIPARVGAEGSVRELVPIANDFGFYWGGHFASRQDGMHFEVAKILRANELKAMREKHGGL